MDFIELGLFALTIAMFAWLALATPSVGRVLALLSSGPSKWELLVIKIIGYVGLAGVALDFIILPFLRN